MLDTGTCAFLLRRTSDTLLQRIPSAPVVQQVISVVTCAGLLYGVEPSSKKKANQAAVPAHPRRPGIAPRFAPISRRRGRCSARTIR
jgi:predicted nucleic acid-binding protein